MSILFNPFTSNFDFVSKENILDGTTAGQMAFWNGTTWTYTEVTELFWDDTNKRLGIGTANPTKTVDIAGELGVSDDITIIKDKKLYFN